MNVMPRLSRETRSRVVLLKSKGFSVKRIEERLKEDGICVSRRSLFKLFAKHRRTGTVADLPRPARPKKLSTEQYEFIDEAMTENDELTARQMRQMLEARWPNTIVSLNTVKRARKHLGWVATRPKYSQLVREANKEKRVLWCKKQLAAKEKFLDVVFTDESTVQLDNHGRLCFRKRKQPRKLKPRPKHPIKVHIWAGISSRGATPVVIFTGIMNSTRYCSILEKGLLPFLQDVFPEGHRFQQDNDPKHCSKFTKQFLQEKGVNWFRTPAESPDLNPIENVWASLKYYLRHEYKPTNMETLIDGIKRFWRSMTPDVCSKYIGHVQKVMPKVIEVNGEASGF